MSDHIKTKDSSGSKDSPGSSGSSGSKDPVEILDFRWKHMSPAIRASISFKFAPIAAEESVFRSFYGHEKIPDITVDMLGGYYYCPKNRPLYWEVFPRPIGFIAGLSDWITELQLKTELYPAPARLE